MSRQKKDYECLNIHLAKDISERLRKHCAETGISKTAIVEKLIKKFLNDYDTQREIIRQYHSRIKF